MIELTVSKLTDMTDHKIIPQITEEICTDITTKIDNVIYKKLFDLKIDKDILINQLKEIHRLNDVLREYEELDEKGLLLKLPFDVNSEVFIVSKQFILERNCTEYVVKKLKVREFRYNHLRNFVIICEEQMGDSIVQRHLYNANKIFLTKREAELELKRMRGEE